MAYEALAIRITANGAEWTLTGSIPIGGDNAPKADAPAISGGYSLIVFQTQPYHGWRARDGQDTAGAHPALDPAAAHTRRGVGGHEDLFLPFTSVRSSSPRQIISTSRAASRPRLSVIVRRHWRQNWRQVRKRVWDD